MVAAPLQPVVVESSGQYVEAAKIALVLAEYIRLLGYPARAHIDGNYRVVLPQLAADAGLGEVGRLSLLITPRYGPRVRLGAVTTTMPLPQDPPISFGVRDFCSVCLKCARNCPAGALPLGGREEIRGTRYWRMEPEQCYRYWRSVGTDCGICVAVCPYSHPRGLPHSFVRTACRRSALSRRLFARADDLFYGRRPRSRRYPAWMLAGVDGEIRRRLRLR
jgi:reductive dehalogenase